MTKRRRPSIIDRFALRLSRGKQIDGLRVVVLFGIDCEPVLRRVEEALLVIKLRDPLRYRRIGRDLERIWVRDIAGALGNFSRELRTCSLDTEFVQAEKTRPELIAAVIVHEATHARLAHCGVGYEEKLRARIEAVCLRRELAFAAKLPNGEEVRQQAEDSLKAYAGADFWTNAAFAERFDEGSLERLRKLGAPDWVGRTAIALRAPSRRVRKWLKHIASV